MMDHPFTLISVIISNLSMIAGRSLMVCSSQLMEDIVSVTVFGTSPRFLSEVQGQSINPCMSSS